MGTNKKACFFAFLAAALYAISAPVSKVLLQEIPATMMAAFLYLGAGVGLLFLGMIQKKRGKMTQEQSLAGKDLPYVIGMVLLDIAAPILLMVGLTCTSAANASLLNNFEIVATSLIAMFLFKETISKKLWLAIGLVTCASVLLSMQDIAGTFSFSKGSLLVLAACICWGFENNCTRMISSKNPIEIVVIKGMCSGTGSLLIALVIGERFFRPELILAAMLLGFVAYGLSIYFYISAQRYLGAARTSTYYAVAPFIGVFLSFIIFREIPGGMFWVALILMALGTYLA